MKCVADDFNALILMLTVCEFILNRWNKSPVPTATAADSMLLPVAMTTREFHHTFLAGSRLICHEKHGGSAKVAIRSDGTRCRVGSGYVTRNRPDAAATGVVFSAAQTGFGALSPGSTANSNRFSRWQSVMTSQ